MRSDLRIGIIVGIILVVAIVYFFVGRQEDNQLESPDITIPQVEEPVVEEPVTPPPPEPEEPMVVVEEPVAPEPAAPEEEVEEPPVVEPEVVAPAPEVVEEPIPVEPAPDENAPRYYTVKKGDSLYNISEKYFGQGRYANAIYEANKDVIDDPDSLKVGWKLRIPSPEELLKK